MIPAGRLPKRLADRVRRQLIDRERRAQRGQPPLLDLIQQ